MSKLQIVVTVFKFTGKWHSGNRTSYEGDPVQLSEEHTKLWGWRLRKLFVDRDESMIQYLPMGGFDESCYYEIQVNYPDDVDGFCHYLILPKMGSIGAVRELLSQWGVKISELEDRQRSMDLDGERQTGPGIRAAIMSKMRDELMRVLG